MSPIRPTLRSMREPATGMATARVPFQTFRAALANGECAFESAAPIAQLQYLNHMMPTVVNDGYVELRVRTHPMLDRGC